MAHSATNGGHGKLWLDEMLRLTKMGAPTAKDYEAYKAHQDGERRMIGPREIAAEAYDAGVGNFAELTSSQNSCVYAAPNG
jgi:hypothetical protein